MEEQLNIVQVDPRQFELQIYSQKDSDLISTFEIKESFNSETDYIEVFAYDGNKEFLTGLGQGEYTNYKIYDNNLTIDPATDLESLGYYVGQYYLVYNFLTNLLGSSENNYLYITEISSDRTEIRLDTNLIQPSILEVGVNNVLANINNSSFYYDFYLNFGNNQLLIANNIQLDATTPNNPTVLIKLYEPLPQNFELNDAVWVVENLTESVAYNIEILNTFNSSEQGVALRGPNFNIATQTQQASATIENSLATLIATNSTQGSSSFQYKLNSLLQEKGIDINIDYSDYSNFIHFSSAQTRLENFYYKLSLIEQYQASASIVGSTNTYTSASNAAWQSRIDSIITNFDGYEYYLYYESASTAWPKSNIEPPYTNYSTTSNQGQNWLTAQLITASAYDDRNKDYLVYAIPQYIREDPTNEQFNLFLEMVGQHFDIIWTYTKDITQKYNADNRLDFGVSKDLVADILRDLGISIYENNYSSQNIYSSLLGVTPSSSLLNLPNTTTTLPTPSGLEYVSDYILATPTSSLLPLDDLNKEIYKRIYHNLPYLLKKKGTTAGLRTLINTYGIPDTVLRINEFGGKDKTNTNDWDNWQDQFNYALYSKDIAVTSSLRLHPDGIPQSIQFRFKTPSLSTIDPDASPKFVLLNILESNVISSLVLEYTGSVTPGNYSGSIVDPYYQHATLKWIPNINNTYQSTSASVYLPFFNEDWWSVMLNFAGPNILEYPTTSSLYVKQKGVYQGDNYILYEQSSSVIQTNTPGVYQRLSLSPTEVTIGGINYSRLINSNYQELRYYNTQISESVFDDFVMNPYSIEGNQISGSQSAYNSLRFRAPLGTDLIQITETQAQSIHPSVTGSNVGVPTSSFRDGNSNYFFYPSEGRFVENQEFVYQDQPNAGIKIPISDKIKIGSQIIPSGDTLSPYISIQQDLPISASYTKDVNYVEVGFSPQDEINDDIQEQFGFFNYGEYIGDPRFQSSSATSYPDLNTLRDQYFQKYYKNNNIWDYIRLIKYFDNSLFKMIQDFVPARTGLATGVIIKQHILERNRYRSPQVDWEDSTYSGSVTTLSTGYDTGSTIYTFDGGTGGSLPTLTTITGSGLDSTILQSWSEVVLTPLGTSSITHDNLEEFYDGEFKGSTIVATTQSLIDADCREFLDVNTTEVQYKPILYLYNGSAAVNESTFLGSTVTPSNGEILLYFVSEQVEQGSPESNTNNQQQRQTNRGTA